MSDPSTDRTGQHVTPAPESGFDHSRRSAEMGDGRHHAEHEDLDHYALLYEDQAEQFATAIPFIREGIERGERCVYVADDNTVEEVLDEMRDRGVAVDAALDSGTLSVHSEVETYRRSGEFDREAMMDFWREMLADATDDGFAGLRAAAEMTWALEADDTSHDHLCEYEELLNPLYEGEDYAVLCQYNRERFPADVLHDVLETHPYLISDATVCENFYYTPPAEYFGPDRPSRDLNRKLGTLVSRTEARSALQTQTGFQQRLHSIVSRAGSFDEKLQAILELGCERFDLELGGLAAVDPETGYFEVEAVSDEHNHLVPGAQVDLAETYCRVVAAEGSDGTVPDPVGITDPEEHGFSDEACMAVFGIHTYLGTRVPISGDADRTFFFVGEEARDRAFTETERTFHRSMAQWIRYELEREQREQELRERTEHLNALVDTTPECIKTVAADGTLLQMNAAGLEMVGASEESAVVGECVYDLIAPGDRERFREFNERICGGDRGSLSFELVGLDGTRRHMESHAAPLERPDGTTVHVAVTSDVTERVERERKLDEKVAELRESEQRLQLALDAGEMGTWELDLQTGDAPARSPQHDRIFGYEEPLEDWDFETFLDHVHPVDRERVAESMEDTSETGTLEFECWIIGANGERRAISVEGDFYEDSDGDPDVAVGVVQDVTERKEHEWYQRELYEITADSTRSFGEKLDALFDLGCERFDLEYGGLARLEPERDRLEVQAMSGDHDHLVPGKRPTLSETHCRLVSEHTEAVGVTDSVAAGLEDTTSYQEFGVDAYLGTRIPIEDGRDATIFFFSEEPRDGEFSSAERSFHHLMSQWVQYELERRQRERTLRENKEQLRALIEVLPVAVFVAEDDGKIVEWNEAAEEIWGGEVVESDSIAEYEAYDGWWADTGEPVEPEEWALARALQGEEVTDPDEIEIEGFDGTTRTVLNKGMPIRDEDGEVRRAAVTLVDITDRKERERELERVERQFEAAFNNPSAFMGLLDPDGTVRRINDTALEFASVEEAAVRGEKFWDTPWFTQSDELQAELREGVERAANGEYVRTELPHRSPDGETIIIDAMLEPVHDEDGDVVAVVPSGHDITEQKEREAELRQTKNRFETVFEQSDDSIFVVDPDGDEIVDANPAAADLTGYTRERLLSQMPSDLHADEIDRFQAFLDDAQETGSEWSEDFHCRRKDGQKIPVEITASAITLDGRDLVLALVRDVTERKKHERYQRDLYEITADPELGFDEKLERLLELGCERFGLEMAGLNHLPTWDGKFRLETGFGLDVDPDGELWTDPSNDCYCRRTVSEDEPVAMADVQDTRWTEDTIYREFGMTSYLGTSVSSGSTPYGTLWFGGTEPREKPFSDAELSFVELMGQWVSYEIEHREHNESQRELYEITADASLSTDEKIDRLLEAGCDRLDLPVGMLTREREDAFEIEHMHGTHPDLDAGTITPPLTNNYCRRVVETGTSISVADAGAAGWDEDALYHEFDLQCYAGTQVIVDDDTRGTVCFTDTSPRAEFTEAERAFVDLLGQCIGYELERQQYERELEEAVDRLQQSNERLEQFAYAASHDLQEPLRMVTSYIQLLENRYTDAFDDEGEEYLEFAVDGAERMREMIDGLLEYSRVETRGDPFEPIELDAVLDDVLADLQIEIDETDAEISAGQLPRVDGDESQLRQVFQNLLDNAITYSGDGSPRIHVDADRRGDEWLISVHDDGIGIEPDDQERIFTVFDRLHSRDAYEGTGLGLALCQRIVERHDGEIWVESEPGEGSTFSFTLPDPADR